MSFVSMSFCIFFIIFIVIYHILSHLKKDGIFLQQLLTLFASLIFYSFADIRFLPFLLYVIIISYLGGLYCNNKQTLLIFIIIDIIPLIFVKYAPNYLHINIIFPLGISFFTFQSISYIVDCYTRKINAEKNILIVAQFISFFPVISSGPIQRADKLIPQFRIIHYFDYEKASDGLKLFAWGMFKKLCVADKIAIYVNYVYGNINEQFGITILLATILYSFQIYCDFSGYSDMAIGITKYMGFDIEKNFDHPYLSQSVGEFWRRWHISLSTWLRDYIYIPLGGSRVSIIRIFVNLFITFLISGIWHGSTWNFIIWGLLHGIYQCIGRILRNRLKKIQISSCIKIFITFCLVTFAWIFFRAENLQQAGIIVSKIGNIHSEIIQLPNIIKHVGVKNFAKSIMALESLGGLQKITDLIVMFFIFCSVSLNTWNKDGLQIINKKPLLIRWILYIVLCSMLLPAIVTNTNSQFLYFAF